MERISDNHVMKKSDISIKDASPSQYDRILEIVEHGIMEWGEHIKDDLAPWTSQISNSAYLRNIQDGGILLTAMPTDECGVDSDTIVGTAHGYPHEENPEVWVLGGIYVTRKNLGVGLSLAQHILRVGREKGFKNAHSYVYEHNHGSLRFLERQGAVAVDEEVYGKNRFITLSIPLCS